MRSTFYGLEVARSGLYTAQNELNVTGHNISNVDTVGFTRQRLLTKALPALSMNVQISVDTHATAGRGVAAITVDQIRSAFTDAKYRAERTATSYWEVRTGEFELVEQLVNSSLAKEGGASSVHSTLLDFYAAINDMATNKSNDPAVRQTVRDAAIKMTESINTTYKKLEEMHNNANAAIAVTVDRINELGEAIAMLNKHIFGYELTGSKANDLRDQRNVLLDELSGLVDIEYFENAKGQMEVDIGGRELVSGADSFKLVVDPHGAQNKLDLEGGLAAIGTQYTVCWADGLGNPQEQLRFTSGELKAYFDVRDGDTAEVQGIPYIVEQLNDLCRKIAQDVNDVHRQGYTMPLSYEKALVDGVDPSQLLTHQMEYDADGNPTVALVQDGKYIYVNSFSLQTDANGKQYYGSVTGVDFFYVGGNDNYQTVTAKNFRLSDELLASVNFMACSTEQMRLPDEEWPENNLFYGNTDNMGKIADLWNKKDPVTGQPDNFESQLKAFIASIANEGAHLNNMDAAQQIRMQAYVQERASISSVSLDEEMTNVVRFTHAYNASARVITAIDEELDTLINKMGLVGR